MDLSQSIEPNSQQVNAEDLLAGPRAVTITGVEAGNADQPVFVHLAEYPSRTYRPSKSMRRVMVSAWGAEASTYTGRRMTLYRDPEVTFGREKVGGIKISHMSHIDKPMSVSLTVTRGKRAAHTVQPLPDAAPRSSTADRAQQAIQAFAGKGIAQADLEQRIGKTAAEWDDADMQQVTAYWGEVTA